MLADYQMDILADSTMIKDKILLHFRFSGLSKISERHPEHTKAFAVFFA
jgi:hypothetical protein